MTRLCALALCAATLAFAASEQVTIESGPIKGSTAGKVTSWKGIPYAAAPTGDNRWRPPQPVTPWQDVRSATEYGADCMQKPFPGDAAPLGVTPGEDCLYVNVWAPAQRSSPLPVMVWIYGGGFVNGGSSPAVYDGSRFAESGVILVSFNYRVGRFGFFAHPALTKAAGSEPLGNYTFMDQIAALKWVRKNVAAFGGDPKNVTLFGESAGGMSVLTMLTSPMSKGLFDKAIIESGGGRNLLGPPKMLDKSMPGAPSAEEAGIAFAKQNGIAGDDAAALAALRALPAEKVVDGLNMATMGTPTYSGPMIDGKVVTESTEQAFLKQHEAKVPVIIGVNSSDIGFLFVKSYDEAMAQFGANKDKAEAAYDPDHSQDLHAVGPLIGADRMMGEPARFIARQVRLAGQPSYEYRFSYVADSVRAEWKTGAPHATEIPYVFDTVSARYGDKLTPQDESVAKAMHAYWIAFAATGKPDPKGLPKWPAYNSSKDELLNFTGEGPKPVTDPWKQRFDLEEAYATSNP